MSNFPVTAWEAQSIIQAVLPFLKEKFLYRFYDTVKANRDRIDVAISELETETNVLLKTILADLISDKPDLPQWGIGFLQSLSTLEGFEKQGKSLNETPIIGQLFRLHVLNDPELKKISSRLKRAINSFMKIYRKESLKYETGNVNVALLRKEQKNLISMMDRCLKDFQELMIRKIYTFIQWLIVQSVKNPSAKPIDIEDVRRHFSELEKRDYSSKIITCLDRFIGKMIGFISLE